MAEGLSSYCANKFLDAAGNNTSFAVTTVYIKLHIGAPGSAGTSNPATETTRKTVSFAAAASGSIASDADIQWTNVSGSEDYTHWTAWDDPTAGNFLFSGAVTAAAVTAGDTFTIPSGSLTASFSLAS